MTLRTALALLIATIIFADTPAIAAGKSKWKKYTKKFCATVIERRDHTPLPAKAAKRMCHDFFDGDAVRQRLAAYMHCTDKHDIRWLDYQRPLKNTKKLKKLGCATDRKVATRMNDWMKSSDFKDAPWDNWPLRVDVLKADQMKMAGITIPKDAATTRRIGRRGALTYLPSIVDLSSGSLCEEFSKGGTSLGHSREEIGIELRRRNFLTEEHWQAIKDGKPEIGMPSCVGAAAFPPASRFIISMRKFGDTSPQPTRAVYECKEGSNSHLPHCPATAVTYFEGRITKMEPYEFKKKSKKKV